MGDRTQFQLQILGADEDYPRFIRAYGRACGGEFAYLCEPGAFSYLVFIKGGEAWDWKQGSDKGSGRLLDVPLAPTHHVLAKDAVAEVRRLGSIGKSVPQGPVTYRGQWKGVLVCNGEGKAPTIVLTRKVAAYATVRITSHGGHADPDGRQWVATLERDARWFSDAKIDKEPTSGDTLRTAIRSAYGLLTGLVGEACSVRDTKRRAALDAEHAKTHPIKHPKGPASDATERMKAPKPPKALKLPKAAKAEAKSSPKVRAAAEKAKGALAGTPVIGQPEEAPKAPKAPKPPKAGKGKGHAMPAGEQTVAPKAGELSQAEKDKAIMDALSASMTKILDAA